MRLRLREGFARVKQAWERLVRAVPENDGVWWAMAALIAIGVVLRARGMWFGKTISLWEDEAAWARWLIELPIKQHVLRSIGFMAVTKALVWLFSASEQVLRFLPWCAGVGAVLVAPLVARRLCKSSAAQLLFVAVIALHPGAIDLSKEFKPYSIALLLHLSMMLFVLRYAAEGKERDLVAGVAISFFGVLFSQDALFAYPALFGLMALRAHRAGDRQQLITLLVGAAFAIGLLLAVYHNVSAKLGDMDEGASYWGKKYDVFYVHGPNQSSGRAAWTAARFKQFASMLGDRRDLWRWASVSPDSLSAIKSFDAWLWTALCVAGAAALIRQRRFLHLTLLASPLLVLTVFNYFGFWPLGAFRTNLFVIAYFAGFAALAFDWNRTRAAFHWQALPATVLVVLPLLTLGRSNHARKDSRFTAHAEFRAAARQLLELRGQRGRASTLALDEPSCAPWRYYSRIHHGQPDAAKLRRAFNSHCGKSFQGMVKAVRDGLKKKEPQAFMLASGEEQMRSISKNMPRDLRIVAKRPIGKGDALIVSVALARRGSE